MQEENRTKQVNLEFFQSSDGSIKKYDECYLLWSVNKNYNNQMHSNSSRRKKIRIQNDNQLERKMSIKLCLLKSGEQLISDMKELVAEGREQAHAYLLDNPHTVEINEKQFITEEEKSVGDYGINVVLLPWIILSKDKQMVIPVDSVLTVVEPLESVTQLYLDKLKSFKMEEEDD